MTASGYIPPFTVTAEILRLVGDISELVGRLDASVNEARMPHLRKENRIKTIQSSLAIENNSMSIEQVTAILEGKRVLGPPNEITEVKNALDAYNLMLELNPYKAKDLLRAHGAMMAGLVNESGRFRSGGVGVFDGERCVHMAPPPMRVPALMGELFDWLKHAQDHLLIRSCVFHFEFEYIHPFSDGNGRMGRLWQSLILGKLSPVFEHLPVENIVHANQQQYYDAINLSTRQNDSAPFIEFMLSKILQTLKEHQGAPLEEDCVPNKIPQKVPSKVPNKVPNKLKKEHPNIGADTWAIMSCIIADNTATADEIGAIIGVSGRMVRKHIATLREAGLLVREGGAKGGRWKIVKTFLKL